MSTPPTLLMGMALWLVGLLVVEMVVGDAQIIEDCRPVRSDSD